MCDHESLLGQVWRLKCAAKVIKYIVHNDFTQYKKIIQLRRDAM